jgi:hypothetical protein
MPSIGQRTFNSSTADEATLETLGWIFGMTSTGSISSSGTFATPDAGSGYFGTPEHYRHLAKGVVDALRRRGLVLVTGDPPASLPMLSVALRKAVMPRAVIEISCTPALDCRQPLGRGGSESQYARRFGRDESEEAGAEAFPPPILVFDEADQLSEAQIEVLLDAAQAEPTSEARVLLGHSSFATRFEGPLLNILKARLTAHLSVEQLDHDEVEAFIRYQLPPGSRSNFLTAQRVALIAITSGGNPAAVNRLARRMLEAEPATPAGGLLARLSWRSGFEKPLGVEPTAGPDASIVDGKITPPRGKPNRSGESLKLTAGIIVCLGILGVIAGAFGSRVFDNLLNDHLLPRKDGIPAEGTPGRAALPMASPGAGGSSSAGATVESPRLAATPEAAAAPVVAAPERPRDAPSLPSAPQPTGSPAPSGSRLSADETTALMARGDAFLGGAISPPPGSSFSAPPMQATAERRCAWR